MIEAARARLQREKNVSFQVADLHELPFPRERFDQVLLFNVLTYAHSPARAIGEAARVLRRGGDLVCITLDTHQHQDVTEAYEHVNNGFSAPALKKMLQKAGLDVEVCGSSHREPRAPHFEVLNAFAHKP
jgi:ArsR family transcriptional regulator